MRFGRYMFAPKMTRRHLCMRREVRATVPFSGMREPVLLEFEIICDDATDRAALFLAEPRQLRQARGSTAKN